MASFQYEGQRTSNAFQLMATSQTCKKAGLELSSGTWVVPGGNGIVLNQKLQNEEGLCLDDSVELLVEGTARKFTVVGFVREIGSEPFAYVSKEDYQNNYSKDGIRVINISAISHDPERINVDKGILEQQFSENGIDVLVGVTEFETQEKLSNHLVLIASTLY